MDKTQEPVVDTKSESSQVKVASLAPSLEVSLDDGPSTTRGSNQGSAPAHGKKKKKKKKKKVANLEDSQNKSVEPLEVEAKQLQEAIKKEESEEIKEEAKVPEAVVEPVPAPV